MYGNIMNRIMEASKQPPVEVGMGVTVCMWSDRKAHTIIKVIPFKSGPRKGQPRQIVIQRDKATRINVDQYYMSENQQYEYTQDLFGATQVYTAGKDGRFKNLLIGHRDEYYDFSF